MGQPGTAPVIHDFRERLEFSEKLSHEPFWQAVYQKAFPDMLWCNPCSGKTQGQYLGIDRVIQLGSGKTLYIDEKKRCRDYKDFFLEYESIGPNYYARGWIEKDLFIDYLAYAFFPSRRCYLLPWLMLKTAWLIHGSCWKERYPVRTGENESYGTYGVCVPIPVVLNAIKGMMFVQLPKSTG